MKMGEPPMRRKAIKKTMKRVMTGGNTPPSRVPTRSTGGVMPPMKAPMRKASMVLDKLGSIKNRRKGY